MKLGLQEEHHNRKIYSGKSREYERCTEKGERGGSVGTTSGGRANLQPTQDRQCRRHPEHQRVACLTSAVAVRKSQAECEAC